MSWRIGLEFVRKQTYITPSQDRAVKRLAARYGTTEAEIVRRALDDWLRREGVRQDDDPFAGLIGVFDGPAEINHDDIYG
jgi:hypothetical protein